VNTLLHGSLVIARSGPILALYAALLVGWGNLTSIALGPTAALPGGSAEFALAGAILVAVSLTVARALGLDRRALGLRGDHARGAATGALLGAAAASAGVVALRLIAPLVVGGRVDYAPVNAVTGPALLWHIAVWLPLGVIVPEEIAFRGVLFGALIRRNSTADAILAAAIAFGLWHVSIVYVTIQSTTVASTQWEAAAFAIALTAIGAGGAIFAWLRLRTGTIATTIATHWSFNVLLLFGLWWTR
jgi:membrane protease YdiL (CAAX protease family)